MSGMTVEDSRWILDVISPLQLGKEKNPQDPPLCSTTFKLAAVTNLSAGIAALQGRERRRDHQIHWCPLLTCNKHTT